MEGRPWRRRQAWWTGRKVADGGGPRGGGAQVPLNKLSIESKNAKFRDPSQEISPFY
uniref:Uncharacterized protein n=1 Tax=Oryza meridionalis TaxID=40149 RepID=A0A1V1H718_9ORYZ|nr:hypothetical protein [Oryza meridionalis]